MLSMNEFGSAMRNMAYWPRPASVTLAHPLRARFRREEGQMRIEVYRVAEPMDVPEYLFWAIDSLDDRYWAAFVNYPKTEKIVVAAWGTTGEVKGEPLAVLVATTDHIITGYVDTDFDAELDPEDMIDDGEPEP